ncbi:recombinase family protein [Pseudarthrobacter oxydans]|uniref:recombinase family protein n=1 Tax=Pseudarthrobacter oxydans TaxID=1671 RepID=UPI00286A8ABE|nr:recombinase family protein [Pseudarthrobacter oxydans]
MGGKGRTLNVIGYARVSTRDQDPQYQEQALTAAGASRVFTDHGDSSRIRDRPQWVACLDGSVAKIGGSQR